MNDIEVFKLLGQSGIAVAALAVLARIVWRVGERMIVAIDKIGDKIDSHTKADTAALASVGAELGALRQDLAVLGSRVDTVIDWGERTPVGLNFVESLPIHAPREERARTPRSGVPQRARTAPERPDGGEYSETRQSSEPRRRG